MGSKTPSSTPVIVMFDEARRAVEAEGVYIGGWSIKNAFVPDKTRGNAAVPCERLALASFELEIRG